MVRLLHSPRLRRPRSWSFVSYTLVDVCLLPAHPRTHSPGLPLLDCRRWLLKRAGLACLSAGASLSESVPDASCGVIFCHCLSVAERLRGNISDHWFAGRILLKCLDLCRLTVTFRVFRGMTKQCLQCHYVCGHRKHRARRGEQVLTQALKCVILHKFHEVPQVTLIGLLTGRGILLIEALQDTSYWPRLVKQQIHCVFCKHFILVVSEGGKIGIYRVGQFTDSIIGSS